MTSEKRGRVLRGALAASVSGLLLCHLLRRLDVVDLLGSLRALSLAGLLGVFAIYLLLGVLRAVRYRFLLDQEGLPLRPLIPITLAHNLLVRTLPWMTGEISYPALVRRHLGLRVSQSLASLLGARLGELLFVLTGGLLALLSLDRGRLESRDLLLFVYGSGLAVAAGGVFLMAPAMRFLGVAAGRLARTRDSEWLLAAERWSQSFAARVSELWRSRLLPGNLLFSSLTYSTGLCFQLSLLRTAGVGAPIPLLVAVISLVVLVSAVPLSVGGLGVVEGGWTYGLVALAGLSLGRAVSLAFLLHGVQLLCALLAGLIGWLWVWRLERVRPS